MSDPGDNTIRGNNSSIMSITKLAISAVDADDNNQYNVLAVSYTHLTLPTTPYV